MGSDGSDLGGSRLEAIVSSFRRRHHAVKIKALQINTHFGIWKDL